MRNKIAVGGAMAATVCGLLTAFTASPASAHCGDNHLNTPDRYSAGNISISIATALLTHPHNTCGQPSGSISPGQSIDIHCRTVTGNTFIYLRNTSNNSQGWVEANKLSGPTSSVPLC